MLTDEERDTVELPLWSIALGLVLGLLGSIAINTGNNLQSMGLKELQKRRSSTNWIMAVVTRPRSPRASRASRGPGLWVRRSS